MATRFTPPREQPVDSNGDIYSGGLLNFYVTGTTTRLDTYSDNALSSANANPVVADSAGRFGEIFLKPQDYKVVLTDSDASTIFTADPVHGDAQDVSSGTSGQFLQTTGATSDPQWANVEVGKSGIINADFRINQRGGTYTSATTPANSDDTFLFDRWILLSDGNDRADISQETSVVPTGTYSAIKFDVETVSATSQKMGILQVLEAKDAAKFIGGTASLSFKARTTSGQAENLRAHVLSWDSTADSVTSDVVNAWSAEGTNPTFVANWTAENTAANLALTNTYQTFKIEGISIDTASAANVAVFIHVDDTDLVASDVFYITDVQLELGSVATTIEKETYGAELAKCQRFYEHSYDIGTAVGTSTENGAVRFSDPVAAGSLSIHFKVTKRAAPTMTGYSTTGASGKYRDLTTGADHNITLEDIGFNGCHCDFATSGAIDELKGFHWRAVSEL
ncbi:hypothetical protein LCGC14_0355130 [marine sediment metagenome]|uniref:Uncharacterized protein n=1 Tax=marine sediment metagenome TaxID=412755 RepID=A0A0F9WHT1_9ZZZZ